MLFFVTHNGEEHRVRVENRRNRLYVTFDDEPEARTDIHFYGNDCTLIKDNRVFRANVAGNKDQFTIWRPEKTLQLRVETEYKRIVGRLRKQDLESENRVTAKMPGKIVKILVKKGDDVKKGTPVLVMEAMKMENEIKASCDGKVSKIVVSEAQAVESGELLLELET